MFSTTDTIVAVATPLGRGGIGVVRLSGPDAERIAGELVGRERPFKPRYATFARLAAPTAVPSASTSVAAAPRDAARAIGDHVIVTCFPAPRSYTGEHVVEISAHGSPLVLQSIVRSAVRAGARLAEPGEFTLRAFLNGKLDLIQAEAVADLIDSVTPLQARAAFDQLEGTLTTRIAAIEASLFDLIARLEASLDFPEEGYHFVQPGEVGDAVRKVIERVDALLAEASAGRLLRDGAQVAIVGAPNVGKSSLFNALLQANRAIVTDVPGTTRDLLTERVDLAGTSIALIDTAGIRETTDNIEEEGVARARQAQEVADLVLVVLDRSRPRGRDDEEILAATASARRVVVANKIDLPAAWTPDPSLGAVPVSVRTGDGVATLPEQIVAKLGAQPERRDPPLITNVRHITLLTDARAALDRALQALITSDSTLPEEFLLADLQEAESALQEISGRRSTEDLLRHIFERFCIGK